jgi:acyl-CoA reductase-like NAD-dependent aldehyde dehydrogenase
LPTDSHFSNGFFVPPTLFVDVTPSMTIARDEVFGPVTCVMPFDDFDEAIKLANDTPYGLVAGVYSRTHELLMRAARRLDVGVVFANSYNRAILGTPFGGTKASGYGREHAVQTLREFARAKAIRVPSGQGDVPQWFAARETMQTGN